MLTELLPSPVFAIGLTGHRKLEAEAATAIGQTIDSIFQSIQRALSPAVALEQAYLAPTVPVARVVTMGAEGADLLGAQAAIRHGLSVSSVLPFPWDEYRHDYSPTDARVAEGIIGKCGSVLELCGTRQEGSRAYERANEVILSNVDLLLAVWDGEPARGRGGTGDVVQGAAAQRLPIIVIDPKAPDIPFMLSASSLDVFGAATVESLARAPLPADLVDLLSAILRPPRREAQRQAFLDFIAENPQSKIRRFEYPLLLRLVTGKAIPARRSLAPSLEQRRAADAARTFAAGHSDAEIAKLESARKTIDLLAIRYGRLFRSSSVSGYFVVILGSWISGVVGLLVPSLTAVSVAIQFVGNALVLADAGFRTWHRWQERWLDYRIVAERLRLVSFRHAFGLGSERPTKFVTSWTEWYEQRWARAVGPPHGKVDVMVLAAAAAQMTEVEISEQVNYHRMTFRRLAVLERRLFYVAHAALFAALTVGVLLAVAAVRAGSLEAVGWKPLAVAFLVMLPATMTALNGYRIDSDLVRLIERSAHTIALLFSIRRVIRATPPAYDEVTRNMQRLAALLSEELADWHLVLESRRARRRRRQTIGKRGMFSGIVRSTKMRPT